jgi:predicted enzyme related to lactoylglutathione lyase
MRMSSVRSRSRRLLGGGEQFKKLNAHIMKTGQARENRGALGLFTSTRLNVFLLPAMFVRYGRMDMSDAGNRGRFIWYDLMTPDPKKAEPFYTKVIGWGTQEMEGMPYTMWVANGTPIGGVTQLKAASGAPPHWLAYVEVADVDATIKQIESLGGKALVKPTDIPTVGRFAVFADPAGAVLALFAPVPSASGTAGTRRTRRSANSRGMSC